MSNIVLKYKTGEDRIVDYNPNVSSIPTRNPDTDERYIKAVVPAGVKGDMEYLSRLRQSANHKFIGSGDLFEFADE